MSLVVFVTVVISVASIAVSCWALCIQSRIASELDAMERQVERQMRNIKA